MNINVEKSEELALALAECGQAFANDKVPFVVVIDGLDHVWRDNRGDVRPLDELFQQLLPLPPNVVLLVGTQPVDDDRLPSRLLSHAPRADWYELPPMTGDAVHGYVMRQVRAGRWQTRRAVAESELARCSGALLDRTHGHPLHVIYSVEELLGRTSHPSEFDIRALPECPGDDIRIYYRALWTNLKYHQRDVLHLMSALAFRWPAHAFDEMSLAEDRSRLTLEGIRHLLYDFGLGLQPFHESLVVFIKEEGDHEASVTKLLPRAEEWLRTRAPARLKNTWHWLVLADLGDTLPLRQGLTRNWLLDQLVNGSPAEALGRMLTRAEEVAFAERSFGEAYRHRMLKTRLLDGPNYQVDNPSRLLRASWTLSTDESFSHDAFVERQQLGTHVLPWLAIALHERGDDTRARRTGSYAVKRWNSELKLSLGRMNADRRMERLTLAGALMQTGIMQAPERCANELSRLPDWGSAKLVGQLRKRGSLSFIIEVWRNVEAGVKRQMLEDAACQLAALSGTSITNWDEFSEFTSSTLAATIGHLTNRPDVPLHIAPLSVDFDRSGDLDVRKHMHRNLVREWFLRSLTTALTAVGEFEWLPPPEFKYRENMSRYLEMLATFAETTAKALTSGRAVPFEEVFEYFGPLREPMNVGYQQREAYNDFRRVLLQVGVDCHVLSATIGGPRTIGIASWQSAKMSPWLHTYAFPAFALELSLRSFSSDIINEVLDDSSRRAVIELQETCTIAQDLLELCELAILYCDTDRGSRLLRQVWDITIGYGHRKDSALAEIMSALEYLADVDESTTKKLLSSIGPQVANVVHFTDGSGTSHISGSASALLAKLDRSALAKQYDEQTRKGEWENAETSMKHLIGSSCPTAREIQSLAKTGLSLSEHGGGASKGDSSDNAAAISTEHQGNGDAVPDQKRENSLNQTGEETVDFNTYPPSAFQKLVADLRGKRGTSGETLSQWFDYWKSQGKSSTLVRYVRPIVLRGSRNRLLFNRLLNGLFEASVQLEGASDGTFDVAVRAQTDNGGWFHFFELAEATEARLEKVAELFPGRADEFIARSTVNRLTSDRSPSELLIPGDKLVFFLIRLGRLTEAAELAQSMADCVIADTSGLVLPEPAWAHPRTT